MKKLYTICKQLNIKKENEERRQNKENKKKIINKLKNKIRKWIYKKEIILKIFQKNWDIKLVLLIMSLLKFSIFSFELSDRVKRD